MHNLRCFDIVLFDLDGTLSNSKEGITKCVQYALQKQGIEEPDLDKLEHFIGPPLVDEFMKSYGFSREQAEVATEDYRERYVPIGIYETCIYPGLKEVLEQVKSSGKIVGLATSKPQSMAEEVLRYLKIDHLFDYVMGAQQHGPRQSKTDVLKEIFNVIELDKKNIQFDNTVLVGDTIYDIVGATNTGIHSIGVAYGFGDTEAMLEKGALCVASSAKELMDILL